MHSEAAVRLEDSNVADAEQLLRRFNPSDPNHVVQDEAGVGFELRPGALVLTRRDGASVYRCRVFDHYGIAHEAATEDGYDGLAWFSAVTVRGCDPSLEVHQDPWPDGTFRMPHRDVAHAVILCRGVSRSLGRRIASRLVRSADRLVVPSPRETRTLFD